MLQTDSTETKHSQQHGVQLIEQHHEEMRQPYQVLHELPRDATPAQQDSALQTVYGAQPRVQEAVPLDSTSLLNRANAIGKLENVELPQYYKQNFFSTDSLWHPELNGGPPEIGTCRTSPVEKVTGMYQPNPGNQCECRTFGGTSVFQYRVDFGRKIQG